MEHYKTKKFFSKLFGDIIQITGIITLVTGITYEIITKAFIGYIIISVGSLIFALGTKIKGE